MDFPVIRAALLAWWNGIGRTVSSKFVQLPVVMLNEPNVWTANALNACARLNLTTLASVGADEVRKYPQLGGAGDDVPMLQPSVEGMRIITVSCAVESTSQDASLYAWGYAEKARARLSQPAVVDALRVAGLAVLEVGAVDDRSYQFDDRIRSRCGFDVRFSCVSIELAPESEWLDTIGSVDVSSRAPEDNHADPKTGLDDVDGLPLPQVLQIGMTVDEDDAP